MSCFCVQAERLLKTVDFDDFSRNHQLTHPLISSVNGYLGGLCPLFIMASDKEVIRDEIIYM